MLVLKRNGLVISSRGCRGGYLLARPPADIGLSEVFAVLEGSESLIYGVDSRSDYCTTHDLMEFISEAMVDVLSPITLESMAKRQAFKLEESLPSQPYQHLMGGTNS